MTSTTTRQHRPEEHNTIRLKIDKTVANAIGDKYPGLRLAEACSQHLRLSLERDPYLSQPKEVGQ